MKNIRNRHNMYVPGTDRPVDEFRKERILVREEFRISKHKTAGPTEYQRRKAQPSLGISENCSIENVVLYQVTKVDLCKIDDLNIMGDCVVC